MPVSALGTDPPGPGPAVVHPTHFFLGPESNRFAPPAPVEVSDTGNTVGVAVDTAGVAGAGTAAVGRAGTEGVVELGENVEERIELPRNPEREGDSRNCLGIEGVDNHEGRHTEEEVGRVASTPPGHPPCNIPAGVETAACMADVHPSVEGEVVVPCIGFGARKGIVPVDTLDHVLGEVSGGPGLPHLSSHRSGCLDEGGRGDAPAAR